ncbi:hypothetical protein I8748_20445 [Nostoc sp. CENA67]|uniref:Uncharacterized protein n=1 Tax=Amazonocrinis nigriterrae CENA67 TaxID=2794033 RepID=A0A8J7HR74_9NOST|nr:hypothetical protein [Amazonocrinis nigriterrae]MBH8564523.1 hypothetical protein [Amazonocrinis nigriterrae CENA67]
MKFSVEENAFVVPLGTGKSLTGSWAVGHANLIRSRLVGVNALAKQK